MKIGIFILLLSMTAFGGKMDRQVIQFSECQRVVRIVKKGCCDCKGKVVIKWQKRENLHCGKDLCFCDKSTGWVTKDKWYSGKWPFHIINQLFKRAND